MKTAGRTFIVRLALLHLFIFVGSASAVKPAPPITVDCSTVSSSDKIFKVSCMIKDTAGSPPESVVAVGSADKSVSFTNIRAPHGVGLGEWLFTVEFSNEKTVVIPFEAKYAGGTTVRVGAVYDPFKLSPKDVQPPAGKIVKHKNGSVLHEYMSK